MYGHTHNGSRDSGKALQINLNDITCVRTKGRCFSVGISSRLRMVVIPIIRLMASAAITEEASRSAVSHNRVARYLCHDL